MNDWPSFSGGSVKLSLCGRNLSAETQAVALAVMRSTRFTRRIPAEGEWETVLEIPGAILLDLEVLGEDEVRLSGAVGGVPGEQAGTGVIYEGRLPDVAPTLLDGVGQVAGLSRGWALEYGGRRVFHRNEAGGWDQIPVDTQNLLFDLWSGLGFRGEPDLWVTGINAVMRYANDTWTQEPGVRGGISLDVAAENGGWGWAAGGRTLSQLLDGVWRDLPWPGAIDASVQAVDALTPEEAWFAGSRETDGTGSLFAWRDGQWTALPGVAEDDLWAIDLVSPAEGWAVGGGATGNSPCSVMRLREGDWEDVTGVCTGHLHAVYVAPDGTTWAVGFRAGDDQQWVGFVLRRRGVGTVTPTSTAPATGTTPTASPTDGPTPVPTRGPDQAWIPFALTDR